jgi:type I restriction enzyme M protein
VQLPGQLFANTQIPCSLWFLSKNREGRSGFRRRKGEILFIDARKLGALIPGSRKQKQFTDDEVERIASVYREFRREGVPDEVAGFCKVTAIDKDVREHNYALTPGRYVGSEDIEDDDAPFEERFPQLIAKLEEQFELSSNLEANIRANLKELNSFA